MYQATISMTKISIILLYLRIFPKEIAPRFHKICWAINVILVAYALAFMIEFAVGCKPISFFWTQWDGEHPGHCADGRLVVFIDGGVRNPKLKPNTMFEI
jgi:hypothetical protein